MKKIKLITRIMTLLAAVYIVGIFFVPSMQPLKSDLIAWMVFGVYLLILFFIMGLSRGHRYEAPSQEENALLNDTKDILKERSKWY